MKKTSTKSVRQWTLAESERAAQELLASARIGTAVRGLMKELLADDLLARRRAANVARLVSARRPGILTRYADLLAEVALETPLREWPTRCYLLLAAVHNAVMPDQRRQLLAVARAMAGEDRIAVRANAIEAIGLLAVADGELRAEVLEWLNGYRGDATAAIRARSRRMIQQLERSEAQSARAAGRLD